VHIIREDHYILKCSPNYLLKEAAKALTYAHAIIAVPSLNAGAILLEQEHLDVLSVVVEVDMLKPFDGVELKRGKHANTASEIIE
jgi:hypothetical protein